MRVRTFKAQFAPLVEAGTKRQTIRPVPKRKQDMPQAGDLESWREWTGLPYRSTQRELARVKLASVTRIMIRERGVMFWAASAWDRFVDEAKRPGIYRLNRFARADGFSGWAEMKQWFSRQHGLPFEGILIEAEKKEAA